MSLSQLPRLVRALTCEPLAMDRDFLLSLATVVRRHSLGMSFSGADLHAELAVAYPRNQQSVGNGERTVAVIPIVGLIANRAQSMGVGADQIAQAVTAASNSARVDAIVLDMDTPGGTVTGVPEAANAVHEASKIKPVVAVSNGGMGSAGYWIGSAANEIVVSPSSKAGSIGVYMLHEDWTASLEAEGVKVTEISAGKYKTEGAPWKPLDEEAMAFLDSEVAAAYRWFTEDVARFRGDTAANVRKGYGEGRFLFAKDAVAAGLADRVGTLDQEVARLVGKAAPRKGARAEVDVAQIEARKRARARGAA